MFSSRAVSLCLLRKTNAKTFHPSNLLQGIETSCNASHFNYVTPNTVKLPYLQLVDNWFFKIYSFK